MVSFLNVTKSYGASSILTDANLSIDDGEFVFLVGKSGAGKTTIMRLLTQQAKPDAGEIYVDGMELHKRLRNNDIIKLRRMIGVIYQDYKLLPERTVAENVALGLEIVGKSRKEIESRVSELLQLIQLPDKADLFPSQISGGEAQRVCIARALAVAPKMLFADEPTGNLDDPTAYAIVRLLGKINELGTTIVMATHNMSLVSRMDKRVVELSNGVLDDKGRVSKSEDKPKKAAQKDSIDHEDKT